MVHDEDDGLAVGPAFDGRAGQQEDRQHDERGADAQQRPGAGGGHRVRGTGMRPRQHRPGGEDQQQEEGMRPVHQRQKAEG